jgi:hypothetical protein
MVVAARIDVLRALCCDFMVLLCDMGWGVVRVFRPAH